ncbi:MAG TPA: M15 family metallopeptidase [Dongiaceae bacterium]|nr:M15 family metallopeptidase [Dongiaceae bacterium]
MRTRRVRRQTASLIKRIWRTAIVVVVLATASTCVLLWHSTQINAEVAAINQRSAASQKVLDQQIVAAKARKAAEEKAKQEAAAKQAAELSLTTDQSSASSIDSTTCNAAKNHNNPASIDVLVNKKHCLQPVTYVPDDLVTSNGATLSAKAITAYNELFNAAAAAGEPFYVTSSYRSYNDQVSTYNYWVGTSGKAGADTYSARPGYSEHQTGLAFDVAAHGCVLNCFGGTTAYQWLQQHAADYGFIQRYYAGYESITGYEAEEWHYRYVGVAVAQDMKAKGVKTLEQYWNIPGGDYY